jgi:hypothetical protein
MLELPDHVRSNTHNSTNKRFEYHAMTSYTNPNQQPLKCTDPTWKATTNLSLKILIAPVTIFASEQCQTKRAHFSTCCYFGISLRACSTARYRTPILNKSGTSAACSRRTTHVLHMELLALAPLGCVPLSRALRFFDNFHRDCVTSY